MNKGKNSKNNVTVAILDFEIFANAPIFSRHEIFGFLKMIDEQENIINNCK